MLGVACGRIGYDVRPLDDASADGIVIEDGTLGDGTADAPSMAGCGTTVHFTDTFDDGVAGPSFVVSNQPGVTASETGGQMIVQFAPTVAASNYASYRSATAYPADGLCVIVEPVEAPANGGALYFKLRTAQREVEMFGYNGVLEMRTRQSTTVEIRKTIALDLATQRFWRLRQAGVSTLWETSTDGVVYTHQLVLDGVFNVTTCQIEFGAGTFSIVVDGGTARFASASATGP